MMTPAFMCFNSGSVVFLLSIIIIVVVFAVAASIINDIGDDASRI